MKEYPLACVPRTASDDQLGKHCRISYSRFILFSAFLDKCKRFKLCGFGRFGGLGRGGGWWCWVFVVWDFWRRFNFCYIHLTSANVNRSHLWQRDTATTIRWKFLKEVASSHSCVCLRSDSLLTTSAVGSFRKHCGTVPFRGCQWAGLVVVSAERGIATKDTGEAPESFTHFE